METSSILLAFSNIYVAIFALFCFKLLIKVSLALLTHFYIVRGNRKEAARIAEEIYGISQGSWADRSPLHDAAFHGRLLTVKTLIAQGFNVNILTIDRISPLHEACLGGHVSCARVLLENGARINIVTVDGITPLYYACSSGSVACVSMLLDHGANPELLTQLTFPLHEAIIRVKLPGLSRGLLCIVLTTVPGQSTHTVTELSQIIVSALHPDVVRSQDSAAWARKSGHRECAEMLISYGADIEKELQNRGTPLYLACAHQKTDCVRRLLELGADVNHGRQRDTPLHAAARRTSEQIVKLLIDYGANVKYKNMEGKYPIELSVPRSPVERALLVAEGPASLAQLCRLSIRKVLGSSCLQVVPRLQLPNRLIQFLLYR